MSAISAEHAYKVFGRRAGEAVQQLRSGASRDDVRALGTAAVIDASFEVAAGETFVVMGLSGSGKSTLIRMVNGLLQPTAGEVVVDGKHVGGLSAPGLRQIRRDTVSMVFQHFALLPHRTVGENAAYALELRGLSRSERESRAERALAMVGLSGWGASLPAQLSGGMRQRVGLARALAAETDVMLMDEAFSALDPLIRKEMQDQLLELQSELGKTILFITHDLNEAMRLGDRIAMMRDGRIVQIGTAQQLLDEPADEYVAQFVAEVDRSRVLTAQTVMTEPTAVLAPDDSAGTARELMRAHQTSVLLVLDAGRRVAGLVVQEDLADDPAPGERLPVRTEAVPTVTPGTPLAGLLQHAAASRAPLAVVDEEQRLLGVIPAATLLKALSLPVSVARETAEIQHLDPTGAR